MVNTSTRPITVDGVRLDTLAWNIEKIERATASRRSGDYSTPMMDGTVAGLNDALEPSVFGLQMWLRGTDADGAVPANGQTSKLRDNLDELLHLFGKRHALLDVREAVGGLTASVTNLATAPRPLVNQTGWANLTAGVINATGGAYSAIMAGVAGQVATCLVRLRNDAATATTVTVSARGSVGGLFAGAAASNPSGVTVSIPAGSTMEIRHVGILGTGATDWRAFLVPTVANVIAVEQVTCILGDYQGPIFDGDQPSDADSQYAWTGAVNASTSTRTSRPYRRCWAKVTERIEPDITQANSAGVFSVALTIPAGMWEEPDQQDLTLTAPITSAEVTTMQGSTERINDAVFLVKGPANAPRIKDDATGMYVELGQNLPAGSFWRFSSGSWASRVGTTLTLGSMDTDGTDVSGVTGVGGPSRAYGLPLVPVRDAGARRVDVTLTATSGIVNGTTQLSIRARRKYAA